MYNESQANMKRAQLNDWSQEQIRGGPVQGLIGSGMDFQPKELHRRTMQEQINFNTERIAVLHKEFDELKQMLDPYIIHTPQCEKNGATAGAAEQNSEMMYNLLRETAIINNLIQYVSELKRDLQL